MVTNRFSISVLAEVSMVVLWLGAPTMSVAQSAAVKADQNAAVQPEPDNAGQLQEVVVTARKRSESLQTVPVSVTAIGAAEITDRSAQNLSDLAQSTPNVTFGTQTQTGGSTGIVFIRGIGQSDGLLTEDPGVGIYLDGVYLGRMQGIDFNALDLERVEVLRGPQGTLFGKNTIGGAINVVTRMPDVNAAEASGHVSAILGNYGRNDVIASVDLPIIQDEFALSVSIVSRNEDGYGRSVATGQDFGNINNLAGRIVAVFKPSEFFDAMASFDISHDNAHSAFYKTVAINENAPLVQLYNSVSTSKYDQSIITPGWYTNDAGPPSEDYDRTYGAALTLTAHLPGGIDVKSISAYRDNHTINDETIDAAYPSIFPVYEMLEQHQLSQEFQISGRSFGDDLTWVGGLYYFEEWAHDFTNFDVVPTLFPAIGLDLSQEKSLNIDNASYAAYGQATYKLPANFSVTAGLRYNYDSKDQNVYYYYGHTGDVIIPYTDKSLNSHDVTPRVSLEYQWTPSIMFYASAASGYKTGGFNGRAGTLAEFNQYEPETVWTYEVGMRSEFLDRRIRVNATAYWSNYDKIQVTINGATTGGNDSSTINNAASARIVGGELEFVAVPIDGLRLETNLGETDAKYLKLSPGVPFTLNDRFPFTPKFTGSFAAEYAIALGGKGSITPRLDYTYRSTTYYEAINNPLSTQHGYGLMNARLTYQTDDKKVSVAAFVTNLTQKQYFTGSFELYDSIGFAVVNPGPPRQFGAQVSYRF